jgi:hypothetical protein
VPSSPNFRSDLRARNDLRQLDQNTRPLDQASKLNVPRVPVFLPVRDVGLAVRREKHLIEFHVGKASLPVAEELHALEEVDLRVSRVERCGLGRRTGRGDAVMSSFRFYFMHGGNSITRAVHQITVATMKRGAMRSICLRRGLLPPLSKSGSLRIPLSKSGSLGAWLPDMNAALGEEFVVRQARPADQVGFYAVQGSRRARQREFASWDNFIAAIIARREHLRGAGQRPYSGASRRDGSRRLETVVLAMAAELPVDADQTAHPRKIFVR